MSEQPLTGISPEYVDGEVVKVLTKMPGLSKASVYYQLRYLPQTLVYSSLKRLEQKEIIGFCLVDSPRENQNPENDSSRKNQTDSLDDSSKRSLGESIRVREYEPKGTARGGKKYYAVYRGSKYLISLTGGNINSPIAQRQKAEVEYLIERGVITGKMPDSEIIRAVQGVKRRNANVKV